MRSRQVVAAVREGTEAGITEKEFAEAFELPIEMVQLLAGTAPPTVRVDWGYTYRKDAYDLGMLVCGLGGRVVTLFGSDEGGWGILYVANENLMWMFPDHTVSGR